MIIWWPCWGQVLSQTRAARVTTPWMTTDGYCVEQRRVTWKSFQSLTCRVTHTPRSGAWKDDIDVWIITLMVCQLLWNRTYMLLLLLERLVSEMTYYMSSGTLSSTQSLVYLFVVGSSPFSVSLFVCLEHNSKPNDPKVFKLGVGNDLGVSLKWLWRSHIRVRLGYSNTTCVWTLECLLLFVWVTLHNANQRLAPLLLLFPLTKGPRTRLQTHLW